MYKDITLFEYAYLVSEEHAITPTPHQVAVISAAAFAYLKKMALSPTKERQLFRLCSKYGVEALQAQNYAGVIFTPDGTQIEVLPKLGLTSPADASPNGRLDHASGDKGGLC
ncbi:McrC family protein [Edwardsiella ictaluri]|uniref:McrC family protein n=1 Tax=Edwardsiella ictaluri TaxID=67780 RepID=A0ABY8GDU4_EDWIC|nr:hypothetical protein [Edwardsiella ictaluri]WFN95615.1 McrC family protein [Edwardsiella ictaluri]